MTVDTRPWRRCASVKSLMEIKDVTEEDAKKIRHIWKTTKSRAAARNAIDGVLRTHGVEYLGFGSRSGVEVYYCNAGDTYATTVIFRVDNLTVGTWGDLAERENFKSPNEML